MKISRNRKSGIYTVQFGIELRFGYKEFPVARNAFGQLPSTKASEDYTVSKQSAQLGAELMARCTPDNGNGDAVHEIHTTLEELQIMAGCLLHFSERTEHDASTLRSMMNLDYVSAGTRINEGIVASDMAAVITRRPISATSLFVPKSPRDVGYRLR